MLYKIECFANIFNRINSIRKNSQTVIYLSARAGADLEIYFGRR